MTLPFPAGKVICTKGWKTQARMTLAAKVDLTPENNLLLTPEVK